jgi:hypothetical protein
MTMLSIGRLSATVHAGVDDEWAGPGVAAMLGHLADHGLDEALRTVTFPPGEWYVRRLDLTVVVDGDRPGATVEAQWAAAVLDALRRALAGRSADVVHHPRPVDGLVELITELAAGRTGNAWAWRRAGLLQPGDPAPGSARGEAVLAAARRRPELASAALVAAVGAVGVPALHRLLGPHGWRRLAELVRAAAGGPAAVPAPLARPVETVAVADRAPAPTGGPVPAGGVAAPTAAADATEATEAADLRGTVRSSAAVAARSVLAAEFRRGRIRPDADVALAWAVLVAAEADPGLLSRSGADGVLRHLAAVLAGTATAGPPAVGAPPSTRPRVPAPARIPTAEPPDRARSSAADPGRPPTATPEPPDPAASAAEPGTAAPTGWAGLLFLLATAEEAGVPGALLDDPALAGRPLRWILAALAPRLLAASPAAPAATDPAVLAFAGLVPTAHPPEGPPPLPTEARSLDEHAVRWATATAVRLDRADDDPAAVVVEVARRRGAVDAVPGWIELHLPLDEVDVGLRRAGLDLDPGWVPWLGAVVRYVYA